MPDPQPPLTLPDGVRLAWEHRGQLLRVFMKHGTPCTAAGEFRKRPVIAKPKAVEAASLFADVEKTLPDLPPKPAAVILVLAARADMDRGQVVGARLWAMGYAVEVREEGNG